MSRWAGRLISKTPITPAGPGPNASAPGVWTLSEAAYWLKQGRWPSAGADPYWSYVSFLLGTTATNAAQNNTFLDNSANNFTITRAGNTTQGSFTPYGSLWSNYFDGNGDYLTLPSSSAFSIATSSTPFTIEAWIYPTAAGGCIFSEQWTGSGNVDIALIMNAASGVETNGQYVSLGYYNGAWNVTRANTPVALNTWTHVAAVFTGSTSKIFYNGVDVTAASPITSWAVTGSSGNEWYVGKRWDSPGGYVNFFSGYISNFRFVNGTAVYTSAFTPPAAPITAISGTSFLSCQNNRFIDNSSNALTVTPSGNTSVTPFSPFILAPPGYNTAANSGSGYFDGNGDYLQIADNSAFDLGAGDWTLETWANFTALPASTGGMVFASQWESSLGWIFYLYNNAGTYQLYLSYSTNGSNQINLGVNLSSPPPVNAWSHIAFVRSGTSFLVFLNGSQVGTTQTLNATIFNSTSTVNIGQATSTYYMQGYLSNLRLVKGTAVYTTAFTPPTAPVTAISGTSLLLNFTNAGIYDAAMNNVMETVGSAQVSAAQAKYGTTSAYFPAASSYLNAPTSQNAVFNTGDFTVEAWIYSVATTAGYTCILSSRDPLTSNANAVFFGLKPTTNQLTFYTSGEIIGTSTAVSTGTWTHVALVRSSGTATIYINGTSAGTASFTTSLTGTGLSIGNEYNGASSNGGLYVDDLRITKGYARYTSSFTPPTQALPVY